MLQFALFFGLLGLVSLPVACGGDDDDNGSTQGGTCEDSCDHQSAAGCSKLTPEYVSFCKQECVATRGVVVSSCQGQLKAFEACQASAQYTCVNDFPQITVQGLCGSQFAACTSCNGGEPCSNVLQQGIGD